MTMLRPIGSVLVSFDVRAPAVQFDMESDLAAATLSGEDVSVAAETEETETGTPDPEPETPQPTYEERLDHERARWAAQESDRIAQQVEDALRVWMAETESVIARILSPFVTRAAVERMIDDFAESARSALSDKNNAPLRIHGPEDLCALLIERLEAKGVAATFTAADTPEATASIGSTIIETRVADWINRLRLGSDNR